MVKTPGCHRLLLDGNILASAANSTTGHLLNGTLFGFVKIIGKLMKKYPNSIMYVAWDSAANWRFTPYPDYKIARRTKRENANEVEKKSSEQYANQRIKIQQFLEALPVIQVVAKGFEADDIAGHFVSFANSEYPLTLVSDDRDWLCLITKKHVEVYRNKTDETINLENFEAYTGGLTSGHEYVKMKALIGDPGDSIPGIVGVGEKTAIDFIRERLLKNGSKWDKIQAWLKDPQGYARSLELVDIRSSAMKKYEYEYHLLENRGEYDFVEFEKLLKHYMFKSINAADWDVFLKGYWENMTTHQIAL